MHKLTRIPVHIDHGHVHVYTNPGSGIIPPQAPRRPHDCPRADGVRKVTRAFLPGLAPQPPRSPPLLPLPVSTKCCGLTLGEGVSVPGVHVRAQTHAHTHTHTRSPHYVSHGCTVSSPQQSRSFGSWLIPKQAHKAHRLTKHTPVLTRHHRDTAAYIVGHPFTQGVYTRTTQQSQINTQPHTQPSTLFRAGHTQHHSLSSYELTLLVQLVTFSFPK